VHQDHLSKLGLVSPEHPAGDAPHAGVALNVTYDVGVLVSMVQGD
jgi:hypothetical protein